MAVIVRALGVTVTLVAVTSTSTPMTSLQTPNTLNSFTARTRTKTRPTESTPTTWLVPSEAANVTSVGLPNVESWSNATT